MNSRLRRFARTDLILLAVVAAIAGLAARSSDREFRDHQRWQEEALRSNRVTGQPPMSAARSLVRRTIQDAEAFLYLGSLGLAVIAYRPRRGVRVRRRGPGHVALAILGVLVAYGLIHTLWFAFGDPRWTGYAPPVTRGEPAFYWTYTPFGTGYMFSYAIGSAWIYLAAIGGWRRPREPFERAGRLVGSLWIIASIVTRVCESLPLG